MNLLYNEIYLVGNNEKVWAEYEIKNEDNEIELRKTEVKERGKNGLCIRFGQGNEKTRLGIKNGREAVELIKISCKCFDYNVDCDNVLMYNHNTKDWNLGDVWDEFEECMIYGNFSKYWTGNEKEKERFIELVKILKKI